MNNIFIKLSDRRILEIKGEDAEIFLQGIISNDIYKLKSKPAIYALLLSPQGKYLHEFFITKLDDIFLLDCPTPRFDELIKKLKMYKLRSKVTITERDDLCVCAVFSELNNRPDLLKIYADPRSDKLGFRAILPTATTSEFLYKNNLIEKSVDEYDAQRISLVIPQGEKDLIPDKSFPLEYKLDELNAIDFNKGCYVGQEVTSRTKHRGVIRKKIYLVSASQNLPSAGKIITADESEIGEMRSSSGNTGLALLRIEETETATAQGKIILADQTPITIK